MGNPLIFSGLCSLQALSVTSGTLKRQIIHDKQSQKHCSSHFKIKIILYGHHQTYKSWTSKKKPWKNITLPCRQPVFLCISWFCWFHSRIHEAKGVLTFLFRNSRGVTKPLEDLFVAAEEEKDTITCKVPISSYMKQPPQHSSTTILFFGLDWDILRSSNLARPVGTLESATVSPSVVMVGRWIS